MSFSRGNSLMRENDEKMAKSKSNFYTECNERLNFFSQAHSLKKCDAWHTPTEKNGSVTYATGPRTRANNQECLKIESEMNEIYRECMPGLGRK